jgi:hypothetical protein
MAEREPLVALALQLLEEPGPGVRPQQIGRAGRDPQDLGRLVARQSGKEAEFDQFRRPGVCLSQLLQHFIEVDEVVARFVPYDQSLVQVDPCTLSPALDAVLAAGVLNEDAAHGLRRCREEVSARVPVLHAVNVH